MSISLTGNPKFSSGDKVYFIVNNKPSVTYTVLECIGTLGATYCTYRIQSPLGTVTYGTDRDLYLMDNPEISMVQEIDIECCPGTSIPYPTSGNDTECPVCHSVFTLVTPDTE